MATPDDREPRRPKLSMQGSIVERALRFWQRSYAGDYLGLILIVVIYAVVKIFDEPFHQMFRLNDYRLQHPHVEHERVPVFMLLIYAAVIPAASLAAWTVVARPDFHKAHMSILGLAITIFTTLFLTDFFKDLIGRPRPDLIARCSPRKSTPVDQLVTIDVCTEADHHMLHDGFRSFPSGHSSFAFAGLGWLALFMAAQTRLFRPGASFASFILCVLPLIGAATIGISRLGDYRHDVEDVIVGSALGLGVAYTTWRRYYPALAAADCAEPYSAPTSGRTSPNFHRVRDEEEGYLVQREPFNV